MKNHYTVRLSRNDRPKFGVVPIVGGTYNAQLYVVASSAEEACHFAIEHMANKTHEDDWEIHSLDMNGEVNNCGSSIGF